MIKSLASSPNEGPPSFPGLELHGPASVPSLHITARPVTPGVLRRPRWLTFWHAYMKHEYGDSSRTLLYLRTGHVQFMWRYVCCANPATRQVPKISPRTTGPLPSSKLLLVGVLHPLLFTTLPYFTECKALSIVRCAIISCNKWFSKLPIKIRHNVLSLKFYAC